MPKKYSPNNYGISLRNFAALLAVCAAQQAQAITLTKADNTDNISGSATTPWVEGVAPTTADIMLWESTFSSASAASTITLNNGSFLGGMKVTNPGGNITLRTSSNGTTTWGQNALLDLSESQVDVNWTSGALRIDNGVFTPTVSISAGHVLTFSGTNAAIVNRGNTKTLTFNGSGTATFNGTATNFGGGAMTVSIAGATVNVNTPAAAAAYLLSSGELVAGHASALGAGNTTVNGGKLSSTIASVTGIGNFSISAGELDLNGAGVGGLTLAANKNVTMSGGTWSVSIADSVNYDQLIGSGTGTFAITGGTILLGGISDYSATYQILSGFSSGSVAGLTIGGYDTANWLADLSDSGALTFMATAVPEPSAFAAITGLIGIGFVSSRRRKQRA